MKNKLIIALLFLGIFLLAAFFRLYGVNWDQDQHLHPDERFLTMVATGISWPRDIFEYLDASTSPLNPHNRGFGFFVYGTFPIFFTKWVAESLNKGDYGNLTLVGRQLSALFDLGTVVLVFLIAKAINTRPSRWPKARITDRLKDTSGVTRRGSPDGEGNRNNWVIGLLAAFFYAASVLPIQLSHFYAVETYLTFFITLSFYLLIRIIDLSHPKNLLNTKYLILYTLLGVSFGLAVASKITAALFAPIIGLGFVYFLIKNRNIKMLFVICFMFFVLCYLTLRLAQPYMFANSRLLTWELNPAVIENWKQLKSFADPNTTFPPAIQWIKTKPYIFPFKNMLFWGIGLPLGLLASIAVGYYIFYLTRKILSQIKENGYNLKLLIRNSTNTKESFSDLIIFFLLIWSLTVFGYEGVQFTKAMRYIYLIYPSLAILSSLIIIQTFTNIQSKIFRLWGYMTIGVSVLIYPIAFMSIYSHLHTRIAASYWVYQHIPEGAAISGEHWDDFVPVSLPEPGYIHERYKPIEFPLYGIDTKEKWVTLNNRLQQVDYIILTSNRLYGSLTTDPIKYPVTYQYYQKLFDGSLGFQKIAEFTSRPNLYIPFITWCITPPFVRYGIVAKPFQECPLPGISFVDDYADETFTVYDHPKVIIFKKTKQVDYLDELNLRPLQ